MKLCRAMPCALSKDSAKKAFGSSSGPSKCEGGLSLGKMFAVAGVQDKRGVRDAGHSVFCFAAEGNCFILYVVTSCLLGLSHNGADSCSRFGWREAQGDLSA